MFPETIIHKIFKTNSSFHVNLRTMGKFNIFYSRGFTNINEIFILVARLGTRLSFYEV